MSNDTRTITQCRICGSDSLQNILSLGDVYVSDFVQKGGTGVKAPLTLVLCTKCYLLQLKHTVHPTALYRNYWYMSGVNQTMRDALKNITDSAKKLIPLKSGDIVVDIGSNDSTLLRSYKIDGLRLVGFEPAYNLMDAARKDLPNGIIHNQLFAGGIPELKKNANIITSIAMFYDLDDPNTFVKDITEYLADDGVWICQMHYTPEMLDRNEYDNICHEHLEYYALYSLESLLKRHGLEVFHVERNDVNAGSFRIYIQYSNGKNKIQSSVQEMRDYEKRLGYETSKPYMDFAVRIMKIKEELHGFIEKQVKDGKSVYVYGASTKGNTILQYCNLDSNLIKACAERNPMKWGLYTIGTMIPIISEEQARNEKPDFFLILPYAFEDEFRKREQDFFARGGKFIIPVKPLG